MFRDPLYRSIRRRLRELADGNAFEMCANDLLRKIHPALAPREGGGDDGLDGLITNDAGESIQLICTTGKDVLRNLTKSISSNKKARGKSHACILATSRRLTNSLKRALDAKAKKLGRPLLQIYDQAAFAQFLYRDAPWLNELLGLTGQPSALSPFPFTNRPLFDIEPIGREADLERVTNLNDDLVLVGQPGSGKTHLLFSASKKAKGRFVIDDDPISIANAVREFEPKLLIVDDAHSRLDLIKRLKHLRKEIGAHYRIIASCWPGQEDKICGALSAQKHTLEPLAQKQIRDVIFSQKIKGPSELLTEIIHQSHGKPGLAVTLCRLCWESDTQDVVLGTALAKDVKTSLEPLMGNDTLHLLACFSIGGDAGMALEAVAKLTGKHVWDIRKAAEQLAAAGILDIAQENRIRVYPLRLRQALVRDVFQKPPLFDLRPYLAETSDFSATTRVLIHAKIMGGQLSDSFIKERLQRLYPSESDAFHDYAYLGPQETNWVLNHFPDKLDTIAPIALKHAPERTTLMLLDSYSAKLSNGRPIGIGHHPEDSLPEIKHWILSAKSDSRDAFLRRDVLASALTKWAAPDKNSSIVIGVMRLVMSLKHEHTSNPPGEPMTLTLHLGLISKDQLSKVGSLWSKVLPFLKGCDASLGTQIADIFHQWIHPGFHHKPLPKGYLQECRRHAKVMMADLLAVFAGVWTFHHHLRSYASKLGLEKKVHVDSFAEILYPSRDLRDWKKAQQRQCLAADRMAADFSQLAPSSIVPKFLSIYAEYRAANISCSFTWDWHICRHIARTTQIPDVWMAEMFRNDAPPHLLEPFIETVLSNRSSGSKEAILAALGSVSLRGLGIRLAIKHFSPDHEIWTKAAHFFSEYAEEIGTAVLRGQVSLNSVNALLQFSDVKVRSVTAINLWREKSLPDIPKEALNLWKEVIIHHEGDDHSLEEIFPVYPDVAFRWIINQLEPKNGFWFGSHYDRAPEAAVAILTSEQKRTLINRLTKNAPGEYFAKLLVEADPNLYDQLLSREELEYIRLAPLERESSPNRSAKVVDFDETWQRMAVAAIHKGFKEEDVFEAAYGGGSGWVGQRSSMYTSWIVHFQKLRSSANPHLQEVGRIGTECLTARRDECLANEKRAAVRGESF